MPPVIFIDKIDALALRGNQTPTEHKTRGETIVIYIGVLVFFSEGGVSSAALADTS